MSRSETRSGPSLFTNFLKNHGITLRAAGKALGCTHAAIVGYRDGRSVPSDAMKEGIERWTGGVVPFSSWFTPDELAERMRLSRIHPFDARRATGTDDEDE